MIKKNSVNFFFIFFFGKVMHLRFSKNISVNMIYIVTLELLTTLFLFLPRPCWYLADLLYHYKTGSYTLYIYCYIKIYIVCQNEGNSSFIKQRILEINCFHYDKSLNRCSRPTNDIFTQGSDTTQNTYLCVNYI